MDKSDVERVMRIFGQKDRFRLLRKFGSLTETQIHFMTSAVGRKSGRNKGQEMWGKLAPPRCHSPRQTIAMTPKIDCHIADHMDTVDRMPTQGKLLHPAHPP